VSRPALCGQCGERFTVDTDTGPLPARCDTCNPLAAERARVREYARQRAARTAADAKAWRTLVGASQDAPAGRGTVVRAIKRVSAAQGREGMVTALLGLAAACVSWARALDPDRF
jgi:hypothetical protein